MPIETLPSPLLPACLGGIPAPAMIADEQRKEE